MLALCAMAPVAQAAPSGRVVGALLRTGHRHRRHRRVEWRVVETFSGAQRISPL
ncbi:hypothetical protein [Cupriavidus basilensis]|uniref:hypothetical protein n=1 Tax=Cupriavidus basilensis TaxID=68895 RepID=UPI00157BA9F5|nr:hypothetical protein [Cupriavidus basilensis]